MTVETMARLAELPRIVGVKDATNDLARPTRTRHAIGADFCQLSGEDPSAAAFLAQGGHGLISVTANVAPAASAALQAAWRAGDLTKVARIRDSLTPLKRGPFRGNQPGADQVRRQPAGLLRSQRPAAAGRSIPRDTGAGRVGNAICRLVELMARTAHG